MYMIHSERDGVIPAFFTSEEKAEAFISKRREEGMWGWYAIRKVPTNPVSETHLDEMLEKIREDKLPF